MKQILFVICVFTWLTPQLEAAKPNVIFMLTDDLGYSDVGCYGADDIATPNIDRMAAEGAKFTSFLKKH